MKVPIVLHLIKTINDKQNKHQTNTTFKKQLQQMQLYKKGLFLVFGIKTKCLKLGWAWLRTLWGWPVVGQWSVTSRSAINEYTHTLWLHAQSAMNCCASIVVVVPLGTEDVFWRGRQSDGEPALFYHYCYTEQKHASHAHLHLFFCYFNIQYIRAVNHYEVVHAC